MMPWFNRHPEWLARQTEQLRDSSVYRETFQAIGQTLVSCGEIVVRSRSSSRVPVLVVFPDSTPYRPPIIVLIRELPDSDRFAELSSGPAHAILGRLRPMADIRSVRHQMPDGSICLIGPEEALANRPRLIDIGDALRRVHDWLLGVSTGHFPPDTPEAELFFHMPVRDTQAQILLTEVFDNPNLQRGTFFLAGSDWLPDTMKVGVGLMGPNRAGLEETVLFEPPAEAHMDLFCDSALNKVELANGNLVTIGGQTLVSGEWWGLSQEPDPIDSVDRLASLLDDDWGGLESLAKALLGDTTKRAAPEAFAAVRFPRRSGGYEWQFFRLERPTGSGVLLCPTDPELAESIRNYRLVALRSESVSRDAFFLRNWGRVSQQEVGARHVIIMGAGALGSEIADSIAKAGIGRLTVVDLDDLRIGNVIRHHSGLNKVGRTKCWGVALEAMLHNPYASIDVGSDAMAFDWAMVGANAVAVSSIADDNIEGFISEIAVEENRTVFFARALRGGKAGRIIRVRPSDDPCLHCLALYRQEASPAYPEVPDDPTLPAITTECNNPVRPGSGADLKLVAALASRMVLDDIQSGGSESNHWVWVSEPLDGYPPNLFGSVSAYAIPKHPNCPICNPISAAPVLIADEAAELISTETAMSGEIETGGVLMGFCVSDNGSLAVTRASGPGPNSVRRADRFHRDVEYCQGELDAAVAELGSRGRYVGEWHYHPRGTSEPSGTDLLSLSQIAAQDNYAIDMPVMLITSAQGLRATVHPINRPWVAVDHQSLPLGELLGLEPG